MFLCIHRDCFWLFAALTASNLALLLLLVVVAMMVVKVRFDIGVTGQGKIIIHILNIYVYYTYRIRMDTFFF